MSNTEDMGDLARVEKLAMEAVISRLKWDLKAMTTERDDALEALEAQRAAYRESRDREYEQRARAMRAEDERDEAVAELARRLREGAAATAGAGA
jgi:hypothetical protein